MMGMRRARLCSRVTSVLGDRMKSLLWPKATSPCSPCCSSRALTASLSEPSRWLGHVYSQVILYLSPQNRKVGVWCQTVHIDPRSVKSTGKNVGVPRVHGTDSYDLGHCPHHQFLPTPITCVPTYGLAHIHMFTYTYLPHTFSLTFWWVPWGQRYTGSNLHCHLRHYLGSLCFYLPDSTWSHRPRLWWVWEPVPEQESRVGLAGSKASPADPHILQEPQVCHLVATVGFIEPPSHLVFIGLDAADIEGLL